MAQSKGNPEINKKVATSALVTLLVSVVGFYLGNRYWEAVASLGGQFFEHWGDGFALMWPLIADTPTHLDMSPKSYMSSAIANRVIDLGFSAFQTDVRYIVNLMEESFDKRQSKFDRVLSYDLLLIEDLGAQRNTSYMMEQVYAIIDGRYKSGKPMVITTNLDPRRINDASGDEAWKRVFDRILERCYPIEFNGSNRRAAKKMEMREAMRKRLGL